MTIIGRTDGNYIQLKRVFDNIPNDKMAMKLDHITAVSCQLLQT